LFKYKNNLVQLNKIRLKQYFIIKLNRIVFAEPYVFALSVWFLEYGLWIII